MNTESNQTPSTTLPSSRQRYRRQRWRRIRVQLAVVVLILATWQLLARIFADSALLPPPSAVVSSLFFDIPPANLAVDCISSLRRVGIGVLLAMTAGVPIGLLAGTRPSAGAFICTAVEFLRPISPIAWIPLAILWFGVGEPSSYFIIFIAAFFPIFTNCFHGARSIDQVHLTLARSLHVRGVRFFRHVLWPSSLPFLITGVRIGLGIAWMAVIASEMVAAQSGLGYMIQLDRLLMRSDRVVAGMVVIGVIGYLMNRLAETLGRAFTPWAGHDS